MTYTDLDEDELRRRARGELQKRPADVLEWSANIDTLRVLGGAIMARVERTKYRDPGDVHPAALEMDEK
jgi:hypothetical protein